MISATIQYWLVDAVWSDYVLKYGDDQSTHPIVNAMFVSWACCQPYGKEQQIV